MFVRIVAFLVWFNVIGFAIGRAQDVRIHVDASQELHRISPWLTGTCIEDVNHEIYGGLYSQMIFGESFQEPASDIPCFRTLEGSWREENGVLLGSAGDGPKLISELPAFADGEVSVEIRFEDAAPGNAGLIARVKGARAGADAFDGYEISLDAARQLLVLGRHRHNWELLREVPCKIELKEWIRLSARLQGNRIEILVNDQSLLCHEDGESILESGTIGLRQWQRDARYRNLSVKTAERVTPISFESAPEGEREAVSGMWRPLRTETAEGEWSIIRQDAMFGEQSQRLSFRQGTGAIGIENRGLNRWGMNFVAGKPYDGVLWARAEKPVDVG